MNCPQEAEYRGTPKAPAEATLPGAQRESEPSSQVNQTRLRAPPQGSTCLPRR